MIEPVSFTPRVYQPMGIEHVMEHERCGLLADMGSGKGVMVLTALDSLSVVDDVWPALAIGPLRVARDVWPKETDKWQHLKHLACVPMIGDAKHRAWAARQDSPIFSINYENLGWLVEYWGDRWPYKTVIADESTKLKGYRGSYRTHAKSGKIFLQGAGGARARALGTVAHEKVKRFIELTGTPSGNGNLIDLWGQMWYLDAGERLGRNFEAYKKRWFHPNYNGFGVALNPGAADEIHARIRDICLTIDLRDYYDLREPIVNNIYVDLQPDARRLYREMEKDMFIRLGDGSTVEAFGAAAKTQKCLQLANGAVYTDPTVTGDSQPGAKQWRAVHDLKMEALDSVIEEANGAALMIVYTFRSDLARILAKYPDARDLSKKENELAFKAGKVQLGVCHPASLGHGVDEMQNVCHRVVHFGHDWPLETYDQINGRIGNVRQMQAGFDRAVFVTHIIARDTVDELVMERRATKRDVQEVLKNAMKRRLHNA